MKDPKESVTGAAYLLFYRKRKAGSVDPNEDVLGGERFHSLIENGKHVFVDDLNKAKESSVVIKDQIDLFRFNEEELEEAKRKLAEHQQKLQLLEEQKDHVVQVTTKKSRSSIDPSEILNEDINIALMRKQRLITRNNRTIGVKSSLPDASDDGGVNSVIGSDADSRGNSPLTSSSEENLENDNLAMT